MRVFIALDLPVEIIDKIKKIQDALPEFVGKKTEIENLHLTLKFFGEVSEDKIKQIKECLRKIKFSPRDYPSKDDTAVPSGEPSPRDDSGEPQKFQVSIDSIGVFSEKIIRIIWLHLTNCDALQKEIDNSLKEIFKPEERFMSHLTIARVKNAGSEQSSGLERPSVAIRKNKKEFLEKLKRIKIPKISFIVENFKLKSSILQSRGPVYGDIEIYPLE